jgi:hypothetical protein
MGYLANGSPTGPEAVTRGTEIHDVENSRGNGDHGGIGRAASAKVRHHHYRHAAPNAQIG